MQSDIKPEWLETDYYKVLGVDKTASASEITKAYRKLARENHPDAKPGDAAAEERFKEVSAAYDVVGDETKRKSYDQVRQLGPMGGGFRGGPGGFGGGGFNGDMGDINDLLGSIFQGGFSGQGPTGGFGSRQMRGSDLETALTVTFDQAAQGATTQVVINNGGGSRPISVRIPAWIKDGQKIRLAGKGSPGPGGGPAGDLYVKVSVTKHETFGRDGDRLTLDVPVTFTEAALGAEIEVPTYSGEKVKLRIPAGSQPDAKLRVREGGLPAKKSSSKSGDLIVVLRVQVPESLTDEQVEALKNFDALDDTELRSDWKE